MFLNLMLAVGLLAPLAFPDVFVGGEEPDDADTPDPEPNPTPETDLIRAIYNDAAAEMEPIERTEIVVDDFDPAEDIVVVEIEDGEDVEIIEHAEEDGDTVFTLSNGTEVVLTSAVGVSPDALQFLESEEA